MILPIKSPPYVSSLTASIPVDVDVQTWAEQVMRIEGIDDLVVMSSERVAYLKLDKHKLDDNSRQLLSQLTNNTLDI